VKRAAAAGLLALGCKLLLGDPDRIIALEVVGPAAYSVSVGDTVRLSARARAANGQEVTGAPIEWAVLDTGRVGIELVSPQGLVIARDPGRWRVQAKVDAIRSDPVTITVSAPAAAGARR
jgi:hypothetical protein